MVLAFLAINFLAALYRSRDDPWSASFVIASYADLLSLFHCLRLSESTPQESIRRKGSLKMAI
ncbi:hypothetical protein C4D60_Mb08t17060 [Musa balbisiana]|uniref:PGG domain-containing protein n=1 Tax=Musa balbisiana TaxID=52838 RepID=A0A4S8K4D5_MUSBA|nr:hypothetical protein C4D60_Mb08t17060 [Musa balbisiana]